MVLQYYAFDCVFWVVANIQLFRCYSGYLLYGFLVFGMVAMQFLGCSGWLEGCLGVLGDF